MLTGGLTQLLAGPSAGELPGTATMFSDITAGMPRSVAIRDGVAYVDFADLREAIPNTDTLAAITELRDLARGIYRRCSRSRAWLRPVDADRCGPTIVARLVGRRRRDDPLDALTGRTVEAHTKQIFQKLRIHASPASNRRVLAVLAFLRTPPIEGAAP